MKKVFLTLILTIFATAALLAQAQFGVKAGFNVATTNDDYSPAEADEPWRPGFNIGLASQFPVSEVFAIAPELIYTQRGFKEEYTSGLVREARFDYLSLPVLFRLSFGDVLKGYVNAGPTFSYWLGGKQSATAELIGLEISGPYEESITFDDLDQDWAYDANRLEVGAAVGGGIGLDTEAGTFLIDLRYVFGLGNAATNVYEADDSFKNQVVSVSLSYLVPTVR